MAHAKSSLKGSFSPPLCDGFMNSNWRTVRIEIPGDPVAWARPRFNQGRAFTAERQRDAKSSLSWQLAMGWGLPVIPRESPVCLSVQYNFKALRKSDIGKLRPRRPDADNLIKLLKDAAQGIIFVDDAQVADMRVRKVWERESGIIVEITFPWAT